MQPKKSAERQEALLFTGSGEASSFSCADRLDKQVAVKENLSLQKKEVAIFAQSIWGQPCFQGANRVQDSHSKGGILSFWKIIKSEMNIKPETIKIFFCLSASMEC